MEGCPEDDLKSGVMRGCVQGADAGAAWKGINPHEMIVDDLRWRWGKCDKYIMSNQGTRSLGIDPPRGELAGAASNSRRRKGVNSEKESDAGMADLTSPFSRDIHDTVLVTSRLRQAQARHKSCIRTAVNSFAAAGKIGVELSDGGSRR